MGPMKPRQPAGPEFRARCQLPRRILREMSRNRIDRPLSSAPPRRRTGERFSILRSDLRELVDSRVLIGDGAMGTLLAERGVGFGHPYARANVTHPEMVAGIHEEYIRAGAAVIETNTFSANRFKLEVHELEDRVRDVNEAGAPPPPPAAAEEKGAGGGKNIV